MGEKKRTIVATFAVVACITASIFGYWLRASVDAGGVVNPARTASLTPDSSIGAQSTFYQVTEMIRREYVESTPIDQRMASGAVRGMIGQLMDPDSVFLDQSQFAAHEKSLAGIHEGIGIGIRLEYNSEELKKVQAGEDEVDSLLLLPSPIVSYVVPGSPADKAGLKPGDEIKAIDGKFIVTSHDVSAMREIAQLVEDKKATAQEAQKLRDKLQKKVENNFPVNKLRDELLGGVKGEIKLAWKSGKNEIEKTMVRTETKLSTIVSGKEPAVRFHTNAADSIVKMIRESNVIDLRNSGDGNFETLIAVLNACLPKGNNGYLISANSAGARPLPITGSKEQIDSFEIVVDNSTRGAAAVFAEVMSKRGVAKIKGELTTGEHWIETHTLPDGSGYLLSTGIYSLKETKITRKADVKS